MFLHKNSGDLGGLRRVEGKGVGVLMAEESRQKRLEIFQKGSQKKPEISTILQGGCHLDRAEKDCQSWVWVPEKMNIGENSYPSSYPKRDKMENQDSDS